MGQLSSQVNDEGGWRLPRQAAGLAQQRKDAGWLGGPGFAAAQPGQFGQQVGPFLGQDLAGDLADGGQVSGSMSCLWDCGRGRRRCVTVNASRATGILRPCLRAFPPSQPFAPLCGIIGLYWCWPVNGHEVYQEIGPGDAGWQG